MTIIAGYAGVGKSYFCEYTKNSIDLHSMPHKWILPSVYNEEEKEAVKAAPYLISNPDYKNSYVKAIIEAGKKYDYVVIPSDLYILKELDELGVPFVLVYPDISLKEHYRKRYLARGNMWHFIDVFIEQWEERILSLMKYPCKQKVVLQQDEHLTDVIDQLSAFESNHNMKDYMDNALNKFSINDMNKNRWLCLYHDSDYSTTLIKVDLNSQYHKDVVFQIGKILEDLCDFKPIWIEEDVFEGFIKCCSDCKMINNNQELGLYLQELQERLKKRNAEFDKILRKTVEDIENGKIDSIPFDEFKEEQYKKTIIRYEALLRDKESNG